MHGETPTFRDVTDEFFAVISEHFQFLAGVTAAIIAGYVAVDIMSSDAGAGFSGFAVGIFVQYAVVERLLSERLPEGGERRRRYWAIFIASLLGGLGMLVGFLLFVVPGIVLLAGWSASTPFIVAENKGGKEALADSWEATRGWRAPIAIFMFISFLIMLFGMVLTFGLSEYVGESGMNMFVVGPHQVSLAEIIPINIFTSIFSVAGWVIGVAVYRLAKPYGRSMNEIFA